MRQIGDNYTPAFVLHSVAAAVSTAAGLVGALYLELEGQLALFAPVVAAASLAGWLMARRADARTIAPWVWVPFAICFVAAVLDWRGLDHFMQKFVGTGSCPGFSCAPQVLVTAPLVGSVSYAVAARTLSSFVNRHSCTHTCTRGSISALSLSCPATKGGDATAKGR